MHIVCAAHCISGRQKSWFQVCSLSRSSSSSPLTSSPSPFPSTYIQVVAGAHNIHAILPEDTVQKRKVADMWAVSLYFSNNNLQIIPNNIRIILSSPEESQITGLEYLVIRKYNFSRKHTRKRSQSLSFYEARGVRPQRHHQRRLRPQAQRAS